MTAPRFTIRDLLWAMALVAVFSSALGWITGRQSAEDRLERSIRWVDQDVHKHLLDLSTWQQEHRQRIEKLEAAEKRNP